MKLFVKQFMKQNMKKFVRLSMEDYVKGTTRFDIDENTWISQINFRSLTNGSVAW